MGISHSSIPYHRSVAAWLKYSGDDATEQISKLAKKGLRPFQKDPSCDRKQDRPRILKAKTMAPKIPEDLYHLIKKAVNIRKHLERTRKDSVMQFSSIRRTTSPRGVLAVSIFVWVDASVKVPHRSRPIQQNLDSPKDENARVIIGEKWLSLLERRAKITIKTIEIMPPKKRAAVGVSKPARAAAVPKKPASKPPAPAAPAADKKVVPAAAAAGDQSKTIRIRVEKFSKIKEPVRSEVKEIGGFPWQLKVSSPSAPQRNATLDLVCLYSRVARVWHCKAERKWRVMDVKGTMVAVEEGRGQNDLFAAHKPSQTAFSVMDAVKREAKKYVKNDTVEIEVEIEVEKEAGDRFRKKLPIDFLAPSDLFDAELAVGEKTMHVNKGILSLLSPVFQKHFFGNPKEEIKFKDEDYQPMIDFLRMLYRVEGSVTADTAEGALQMAHRFKVQPLIDHAEKWLYSATDVKVSEKIRLAEMYELPTLMRGGLKDVHKVSGAREEVMHSEAFKKYSAKTKKAVRDAMKKAGVSADGMIDEDDLEDYVANYLDELGYFL